MIHELDIVDAEIVPAIKTKVVEYNVRNYRMRDMLEMSSRLLLYMVHCDSNNTNATVIPSDARVILDQWAVVKEEFAFSLDFNDAPKGSHEYAYHMYFLEGREIQAVRNVAVKTVIAEVFNAVRVMISVDYASTQGYIDAVDQKKINRMF